METYKVVVKVRRKVSPPTTPPTYETKTERMEVDDSGVMTWKDGPIAMNMDERELLIRTVKGVCGWLKNNGGTSIEVSEKEGV